MDRRAWQRSLVGYSPQGHKELDTTEWLNWTELMHYLYNCPILLSITGNLLLCLIYKLNFYLVIFQSPVMSDSLWPHGQQHAKPRCLSPSPRVCPSSCSLHQWWDPAISYSDTLFSFCPLSFPASGIFPMSRLFTSDNQNTGASAPVLPVNIQVWSSLKLVWSPCIQGTFRSPL